MVHQYHSDKYFGKNLLDITHLQAEEVIYVQNQHQYIVQFRNLILIIHTIEVTSVAFHNQFLKD